MTEQERCLRMAEECERMARRTPSPEDRNTLLNMAQLWCELAGADTLAEWVDQVAPARESSRRC
jgi:hypothetical protein